MQKLSRGSLVRTPSDSSLYKKTLTHHGIRVVSEGIPHVRSVSIGVWAPTGSRDETGETNGLSHFLEHMVFKGTANRSIREIAQSLESLGGFLNAFTTKEHTCFYARVLDAHVEQAVDVLADLVQNATFDPKEIEKEKQVVLEELRNAEDDPEDIIHDYLEKAVFPGHSLGFPIIGSEENLHRFKRSDLQSHLETGYGVEDLVVSAAGNLNHDDLARIVERRFRRRSEKRSRTLRPGFSERPQKGSRADHARAIMQAHVCLGRRAYSMHHPDRFPLLLMNTILGEGMSSRLYQTIREKHGLAYTVYTFAHLLSDTGVFGGYVGTDRANIEPALELIHAEFARLQTRPVPKAELERTKNQIKGTMMLGLESMSGRMMRLGTSEMYYGMQITLDSVLKKVDAVTPESIQMVARDLLSPEEFCTIVIRPS